MASDAVKQFTDSNFDQEVLQSDVPVLVDFWAEWCMPCQMLAPTIDELAEGYDGKAKIGKLNTDANRDTAVKYNISAIPTILLFQKGEVVHKFVGMTSKQDFEAQLKKALEQ